ncbi:hypothetical protein SmJEL517_g02658 [Synchytrium microbalum]|uniref:ubiquitinyl hydrolase 1 n=1 Tax=Synchytrium microbalum TaxID=1806994 RepID=A0A507C1A2_9FUNG|nr:uncharacterized protein SmJEL517_g02658 [Synchytrium microbalum]TPX34877.1 hypothetical protein SmJEL517_g02658 [Synchytrium microbalum]
MTQKKSKKQTKQKPAKKAAASSQSPTQDAVESSVELDPVNPDDKEPKEKSCHHVKGGVRWMRTQKNLATRLERPACKPCRDAPKSKDADDSTAAKALPDMLCLFCGDILCKEHANAHHNVQDHKVYYNLTDMKGYCYPCGKSLDANSKHQILMDVDAFIKKQKDGPGVDSVVEKMGPAERRFPNQRRGENMPSCGYINLGNTCFFNSVMQCLTWTTPLFTELQKTLLPSTTTAATESHIPPRPGPLTSDLNNVISSARKETLSSSPLSVSPEPVFRHMIQRFKMYKSFRQQDSHELLRRLVDAVTEEQFKGVVRKSGAESQKSFVEGIFQGRWASAIVCDTCKNCSLSYEEYMDISLPIINNDILEERRGKSNKKPPTPQKLKGKGKKVSEAIDTTVGTESAKDDAGDGTGVISLSSSQELSSEKAADEISMEAVDELSVLAAKSPYNTPKQLAMIEHVMRPLSVAKEGNNSKPTLMKGLLGFMAVDVMDGDNKLNCEHCFKLKYPDYDKTKDEDNAGSIPVVPTTPSDIATDDAERTDSWVPVAAHGDTVTDDTMSESRGTSTRGISTPATPSARPISDSMSPHQLDRPSPSAEEDVEIVEIPEDDDAMPVDSLVGSIFTTKDDDDDNEVEVAKAVTPKKKGKESTTVTRKGPPPVFTTGRKRYLLASPQPEVLVLHLKRFHTLSMGRIRKVEDFVEFDELIDLEPFVVPDDLTSDSSSNGASDKSPPASWKYRVNGIVVHSGGGYTSGHYTAYVRLPADLDKNDESGQPLGGNWVYTSDTHTRRASWQEVSQCEAYVLFYEKV